MSLFLKNKKKQCILVFAFLILFASLFSIKKSFSLIEDGTHYALGTKGSTIFVYNSTPHYILEASKIYIISNGYNGTKDINFSIINSNGTYCVKESYKNIDTGAYFVIDNKCKIIEQKNLKPEEELTKIITTPDIGGITAIQLARKYLNIEENIPAIENYRCLKTTSNNEEMKFCYKISFQNSNSTIYIDGVSGEEVK